MSIPADDPVDDDPVDDPGAPDLAAAEYVLGTLPPDQARALEALALADPAVAASVRAWEARLAPLTAAVPPVPPPRDLWRRLALATGIEDTGRRRPRRSLVARAWASAGLWRGVSFGSALAAAALAFLVLRPPVPAGPGLVAALSPSGAPGAAFVVRIGSDGSGVIAATALMPPVPGRSLELWALVPDAAAPVSLGVLPADGRARLRAPARAGTQILVSSEPSGGSPTGQPTGPVLFGGTAALGW